MPIRHSLPHRHTGTPPEGDTEMTNAAHNFNAADLAWHHALIEAFGRDAGQARYEARGAGDPGTKLRAAYDARMVAFRDWRAA